MRLPTPRPARLSVLVPALTLLATAAAASPILVTLEDAEPGGFGNLAFTYDPARQGPAPYDYPDIDERTGDWQGKQEDYRINVADYFHAQMGDWTGYGLNWLLERYPPGLGIYEEHAELHFFGPAGRELMLFAAWTTTWAVGTPIGAALFEGDQIRNASMRIASIEDVPDPVPEPGTLALMGAGLAVLSAFGLRRKPRP